MRALRRTQSATDRRTTARAGSSAIARAGSSAIEARVREHLYGGRR